MQHTAKLSLRVIMSLERARNSSVIDEHWIAAKLPDYGEIVFVACLKGVICIMAGMNVRAVNTELTFLNQHKCSPMHSMQGDDQNSEVWLMTACFQCIYLHCISPSKTAVFRWAAEFTFDVLLPNEVLAWVLFMSSLTASNLLKMYPAILRLSSQYKRHFAVLVF